MWFTVMIIFEISTQLHVVNTDSHLVTSFEAIQPLEGRLWL